MAKGTIKNLVSDRGFGFIRPEEASPDGKDLFFHRSDVQGATTYDQLQVGQPVEYDLGQDERRGTTKATNVRLAES
jgi:CspA family cold shock protein